MTERDEARDVLEEAREKVRYLDEARAYGITPLEGELRGLLAGMADALAESRSEVERLRCVLRGSDRASLRLVEASNELRAEVEKVLKLRDVEARQLCQQWETAADWAAWFAAERDEALAEVERLREQVGAFIGHSAAASRTADRAIAERDEALAAIERAEALSRPLGEAEHHRGRAVDPDTPRVRREGSSPRPGRRWSPMSDRDVIAETISAHTTMTVARSWPPTLDCRCGWKIQAEGRGARAAAHAEHLAAHVAAALRESRTVRTVAELDALPHLTVIREIRRLSPSGLDYGAVYERHYDTAGWKCISGNYRPVEANGPVELPARILYRPGEDGAL